MLLRQLSTRQAPKVSQLPIFHVRCYTRKEEGVRSSLKPIVIGLSAGTLVLISYALSTDLSRAITPGDQPLSSQYFASASIVSSEESGPSTKLITLTIPRSLIPEDDTPTLPVHSIYIKDDDVQIERPYSPLYGIGEDGRMVFWIKRYEGGEVGRWLHSKRVGEVIEIRGPVPTLDLAKEMQNDWDDVFMISGGTGITPFFQLINSTLRDRRGSTESKCMPHFTLLHSSPSPLELPPPTILSALRSLELSHPSAFTLKVFVDSPHPSSDIYNEVSFKPLAIGRITKQDIAAALEELGVFGRILTPGNSMVSWFNPFSYFSVPPRSSSTSSPRQLRKVLFLVCGPEPMINAIAGPRARDLSAGPVRGALGALGFTASQVRKL